MKGLLIKEFYSMKSILKQFGFIILAMGVWCCVVKNPTFFPMITTMYGAMMILTSMSYDETVHFDKYMITLPLRRNQIVFSKYLLMVILILVGAALGIAGDAVIRMVVPGMGGSILEDVISMAAVSAVFTVAFSILLPITFKLGVEKGRLILVVVYFVMFGAVYGMISLLGGTQFEVLVFMEGNPAVLVAAGLAAVALALCVSCLVSVKIVQKKEW